MADSESNDDSLGLTFYYFHVEFAAKRGSYIDDVALNHCNVLVGEL